MRLRRLGIALLIAFGVVPCAAARDVAELECLRSKATPQDDKVVYDAALAHDVNAAVERTLALTRNNLACFDKNGLNATVGHVAGHYIADALISDYIAGELRGVPNALAILDAAIAKMPEAQRRRMPENATDDDRAWLAQTVTAAGLDGDNTRSVQARLYILCQAQMSLALAEWRAL